MIDIITTTLIGLNNAIDITKSISSANVSISEAQFKMDIATLMVSLATSKSQIAEIKYLMLDKESQIERLQSEITYLISQDKPEYSHGIYKFKDDEGFYCTRCWDDERRKFRVTRLMTHGLGHQVQCVQCKTIVSNM
ncbi:MAG: hypothetical protein ABSF18_04355 [Gammaproteobacteria bacterium]|jgi:hypothetical protein